MNDIDVDAAWRSVWEAIDTRRVELKWSKADLYRKTGVSQRTFQDMESIGRPLKSKAKRRAIADAVGWPADAFDQLLAGRDLVTPSLWNSIDWWGGQASEEALRDAVRSERVRRGVDPTQAANVGGFQTEIWTDFEDGGPFTEDVRICVAIAFQWPDSWPHYVGAGRDPNMVSSAQFERFESEVETRLEWIEHHLMGPELSDEREINLRADVSDRVEQLERDLDELQRLVATLQDQVAEMNEIGRDEDDGQVSAQ